MHRSETSGRFLFLTDTSDTITLISVCPACAMRDAFCKTPLLPALGFMSRVESEGWLQFEAPGYDEGPGYYAVFFEDPDGNRF